MINLDELNKLVESKRRAAQYATLAVFGIFAFIAFSMFRSVNTFSFVSGGIPPIFVTFFVFSIAMIGVSFIANKATRNFANDVKTVISQEIFAHQFENYSYEPEGEYPYTIIKELDILPLGDNYSSNDLMKGKLHDVSFTRSDITTTSTRRDSDGHSHTTTHFKGQVYAFDFFKNSNSYIRIRDRSFSKFGKGRKVDGSKHMKFEDEEFNDLFRCYSNNDHEAFYVFTPHFMNKLKEFRNKLNLHLSLIIHNSMLYIAIYSNTDSFEPSIWRPIDQKYLNSVNKDIEIIKTIIDDLDLKNTLFK